MTGFVRGFQTCLALFLAFATTNAWSWSGDSATSGWSNISVLPLLGMGLAVAQKTVDAPPMLQRQADMSQKSSEGSSTPENRATVDDKTVLEWCFVVSSLDLAVLGFLYNTFAAIRLSEYQEEDEDPLPILKFLKFFCRTMAGILVVLWCVAFIVCIRGNMRDAVWVILACFAIVCAMSIRLVILMRSPNARLE